jgi:hypothetical protein
MCCGLFRKQHPRKGDATLTRFYPSDSPVPGGIRTRRLLLQPLRASDVELDYAAVMSSPGMLRDWCQCDWPADDFTLEENLADLQRHEREHLEKVAFTFTVLTPDAEKCLGCVYLTPPWSEEAQVCGGAAYPASVSFWVRQSEVSHNLDRHLLGTLLEWLKADWRFDCRLFTVSMKNERQRAIFQQAGLSLRLAFETTQRPGHWQAYTDLPFSYSQKEHGVKEK